jgi:hypothetical protein
MSSKSSSSLSPADEEPPEEYLPLPRNWIRLSSSRTSFRRVTSGRWSEHLSAGYDVSRSKEGPPRVRPCDPGGGFEQLVIEDAASIL